MVRQNTSTPACSVADIEAMNKAGPGNAKDSLPALAASCGKKAFNIFSGWKSKKYVDCLTEKAGISSDCASCFEGSGKYGADNCKAACMFSWCSKDCIKCVNKYLPDLVECIGSTPPPP